VQNDAESGMIDLVVGRGQTPTTGGQNVTNDLPATEVGKAVVDSVATEGDPDFASDRSRLVLMQKNRVDESFSLNEINIELSNGEFQGTASNISTVSDSENGDGAVVIKSDKVRVIARSDIEFLVTTYERDENGKMRIIEDTTKWAAIVLKPNGDIVFRPAEQGVLKWGGDDADKAVLCTDFPAQVNDGKVDAPPIVTTMAGMLGGTKISNQGMWATKVLIK